MNTNEEMKWLKELHIYISDSLGPSTNIKWLKDLYIYISELLGPIIKNPSKKVKYLDQQAMKIWVKAFTHETVSPTENYEDLEFLGDAILKAVFPIYLMKKLPFLHKGEFTELNVFYMSKIKQAQLARNIGLNKHIRVSGIEKAILNLEADVFESFFGALYTIADNITPGLGFSVCYNMILYIFKDEKIDVSKGRGSAKTQVIQMFVRFDLEKPQGIKDDSEKNQQRIKFSVVLNDKHIQFLESYEVYLRSKVIGYGIGATKREAEFLAYEDAFNTLLKYNITTDWAEKAKQIRDFTDQLIEPFTEKLIDKYNKDGFVSIYFFIPRKTVTPKGAVVQLIGVREDGTQKVLSDTYATDRENSYAIAKAKIVEQYVSSK